MALALFNPFVVSDGSPPVAFARTDNSGRPITRRHPLTLIVRRRSLARSAPSRRAVCACTHYLVFKEPTAATPEAPGRRRLRSDARFSCADRRLGEPSKVTRGPSLSTRFSQWPQRFGQEGDTRSSVEELRVDNAGSISEG